MLRKVELFIHKGRVIEKAPLSDGPGDYGRIQILDSLDAADETFVEVYTHYRHSFLKDENNNIIQPEVNDEVPVYCFLIPMEYLFSDVPGEQDDTPLLAVNVTTLFPYIEGIGDVPTTRHPCTTALTIAPDSFSTNPPSELQTSFLLLPLLSINYFLYYLFHKNRNFFYGINDYGELTIIEAENKEDAAKITPWTKIVLEARFKHHALFSRVYSPKRKKLRRDEFKILKQKFDIVDKDWVWKFKKIENLK